MKNSIFICMISLGFIMGFPACDQPEFQDNRITQHHPISVRIDNCNECPMNDCCCAIQRLGSGMDDVNLCGTTSPDNTMTTCGPVTLGSCEVEGFILEFDDIDQNEIRLFCMEPGTSFWIYSAGGGTYRITCTVGQISPQSIDVDLDPDETKIIGVSGGCLVALCP